MNRFLALWCAVDTLQEARQCVAAIFGRFGESLLHGQTLIDVFPNHVEVWIGVSNADDAHVGALLLLSSTLLFVRLKLRTSAAVLFA
ncbi:hypothetical protein EBZ80_20050 [bacterium]|nr:hypothetical protein [bacterium]